ncbi:RHS repeat-associated core domain-containing protein [Chitinophaga sp. CF118]|uniref:RHS repeat domain-containing protein n=1 Tax=Chitinophaga sp. CF118 TaxID=1884367 RepID=UPI0008EE3BB1|nr:RHS repeat-associated core domain-containing protein [Chitinophaga sp. CF118]SFE91077.1 RHS repeat-associated core domain-containing protein [Chitinophaga sp. CF118]
MHLLLKQKVKWFILLILLAVAGNIQAQSITVLKKVLDGSKGQIATDSTVIVRDSIYFVDLPQLDTPYLVKNIITLRINEYSTVKLPTVFSATVNLRIIYTRPDLEVDSIDKTLTLNYSDTSAYTSRTGFVFNNAHRVEVKILSVSTDASSDVLPVLLLENEMDIHPVYKLSCIGNAVQSISYIPPADSADQITVNWDGITGADVYDLEWTYADSSALANEKYGNPISPLLLFRNNASRVTLADTKYNIPLMYDSKGVLFFRVRAVQEKKNNVRIETAWSSTTAGGLGSYSYDGHHRSLNWQSNISFAEDGKRKVSVQYFDGSLRNRQIVTKDNSTNTIIVGESLYDYQGRPVIQVMPAPSLGNVIKYSRNFNVALNGSEYDKGNYDTLLAPEDFLTTSANGMSSIKGANQYYSSANPEKDNGFNKYLPDAGGFAFTETSYTQDNTGRISRQSGVGPVYKLGSNHETIYEYGSPGENDLDVLFGTEAGEKTHYFKNRVKDANGQYAVSYLDMHGRTIATALAGMPDSANLENLSSNVPFEVTDTLSRPNSNVIKDLVLESSQSQLVALDTVYQFKYTLIPPVLQKKDCDNNTICYVGRYDLEIKITDDVFNQHLGGQPFDTILHNYTAGSIITDCGDPQPITVTFSRRLPRGNYEITKRLTINRTALEYYRDSIFMKKNLCTTIEQFVQEQRTLLLSTQCVPDCKSCRDSIGTWEAFKVNYMRRAGIESIDTVEIKAAYAAAIEACDALCNETSDLTGIRNAMLGDMNPASSGQYANVEDTLDIYSIFYQKDENTKPPYQRDTIHYTDGANHPDSVYNELTNTYVIPQKLTAAQFTAKFKASWADSLLKFHPEYCKLLEYQKHQSSHNWDRKFEAVDSYKDARDSGYLNPTANSTFGFTVVTAHKDSLAMESAAQQQALEDLLKNYNKRSGSEILSMWSVATITLKCTDAATSSNCFNTYGTSAAAFNESNMCTGDLDMAWRNFRQMYLTVKKNIINDKLKGLDCAGATGAKLVAACKTLNFTNVSDVLNQNGLDYMNTAASGTVKDSSDAALARSYAANCNSYVSAWVKQLSGCTYYDTAALNNDIIPKLLNVCKEGADIDHPYGASTTKPGSTYTYSSFQAVLSEYNQLHGINDTLNCNIYQITSPRPYDKQIAYGDRESYTKPTDCECNNLHTLQTEFNANKKPVDSSFSAYLYRTRGVSLTTLQLNLLLASCDTSSNNSCTYLATPVTIPVLIQCNIAPPCAYCEDIDTLYNRFARTYPGIVPQKADTNTLQQKKNQLFAAYMNHNLGFGKQAWEYLTFMDSCKLYNYKDSSVCKDANPGEQRIDTYSNDSTTIFEDVISTADSGFLMVGRVKNADGNTDGYIVKTDAQGNVLWSKSYGGYRDDYFNRAKVTTDGGYIVTGTVRGYDLKESGILLVKMDSAGVVTWSKSVGYYTTYGETGADVIQTSDGGYAFSGRWNITNGLADGLFGAVRSDGTGIWVKRIGKGSGDEGYSMVQNNDTLVIVGCTYFAEYKPVGRFSGVVLKINRGTGAIINSYEYDLGAGIPASSFSGQIYKRPYGYLLNFALTNTGTGKTNNSLVKINENGAIISAKTLSRPLGNDVTQLTAVSPVADGGIIAVQNVVSSPYQQVAWHKINSNNTIAWSDLVRLNGKTNLSRIIENSDHSISGVGYYGNNALLMRTLISGKFGCSDTAINVTYDTIPGMVARNTIVWSYNFSLSVDSIKEIKLVTKSYRPVHAVLDCNGNNTCVPSSNRLLLCGNATPLFPSVSTDSINNCSDNEFFAVSKGTELFKAYRDSVKNNFEDDYIATSLQAGQKEVFTVHYATSEYHYTLYYYDQAGNLLKTVPPAGVVIDRSDNWINRVKAARAAGDTLMPPHRMVTQYRYNTLNQVVAQQTPDAGTSKFWYDRLGRLAVSQNAKQTLLNQYSYTTYDVLGRISEVGEITSATAMTKETSRNAATLATWISNAAASRTQITVTNYDLAYSAITQYYLSAANLRNRVSWSAIYNTAEDQDNGKHAAATFYSYDIHGNVDTLLQDYKLGGMKDAGHRFKKMVYRYDLISGKVNQVAYQPGKPDAFYHRYSYDAENRITNVETSHDSVYWENDAYYQYYKHGPLAKTIIGQQQVQGLDYAYTLQGWLKGVNSTALTPAYDIGHDGATGSMIAKDVFGFALHYYGSRDYSPVSNSVKPFAEAVGLNPLFNGNIGAISQHLSSLGTPLMYSYNYDVLNRLKKMQASNGLNVTNNTWTPVTLPDFKESISYDANGNILTYNRKGNNTFAGKPLGMDSMAYTYQTGTNKLDFIDDKIDNANYDNDIDNQSAANYTYDAIGNLITDNASSITNITWTVYGKIASITSSNKPTITYTYDVAGNRISKTVNGVQTWYVRDATGNVMSIYTKDDPAINSGAITQTETHLYGSSRLGINTLNTNVDTTLTPEFVNLSGLGSGFNINFIRGKKFFELSNHLGNVLATVSDRKTSIFTGSLLDHYEADVVSSQEYYPFGMQMPGRGFSSGKYRYGFNGKENDNEVKGEGNQVNFEARAYDPRLGKFLSIDPLTKNYPNNSPYIFAANNPITLVDALGMWPDWPTWLSWPDHAPSNTWEYIQYGFYKTGQFIQEGRLTGWTETGRQRQSKVFNAAMSSTAGGVNGLNSRLSGGMLNRSPESLGINEEYAGYYKGGTLVSQSLPGPGALNGTGTAPRLSMVSNGEGITTKAVNLEIKNVSIVLANATNGQNDGQSQSQNTPGRVQSRINITKEGWEHVLDEHFSMKKKSQFLVSENRLRSLLRSSNVVNTPITRTLNSNDGTRFVREITLPDIIGTDKFNGYRPTNIMTVLTDRYGNLVTASPGIIK